MARPVLIILGLLGFFSCRNSIQEVRATAAMYEPATEIGRNIHMKYTDGQKLLMTLEAREIIRHNEKEPWTEFPAGVIIRFYNDSAQSPTVLQAGYARQYEQKNLLTFRDSVKITGPEHSLVTDELTWNQKEHTIHTDKFVKIVTPNERISGTGLEADEDLSHYKILNITGTVHVEEPTDENL